MWIIFIILLWCFLSFWILTTSFDCMEKISGYSQNSLFFYSTEENNKGLERHRVSKNWIFNFGRSTLLNRMGHVSGRTQTCSPAWAPQLSMLTVVLQTITLSSSARLSANWLLLVVGHITICKTWKLHKWILMNSAGMRGVLDHITSHTVLYPVHQLVGPAAIQQSSDGWKWVKNNGLWMSVDIILQDQWNRAEQWRCGGDIEKGRC